MSENNGNSLNKILEDSGVHHHHHHHHHSDKPIKKVWRTVKYVLTPFFIILALAGVTTVCMIKPYSDVKPYLDIAFRERSYDMTEASIKKYKDDNAPVMMGQIVDESTDVGVDSEDNDKKTEENKESVTHTIIYPYVADNYATLNCKQAGMYDLPVFWGQSDDILDMGVGQYNASVYIGNKGNVVLCAHNHTYFYYLPQCQIGYEVTLETSYVKITYKVSDIVYFKDNDTQYVMPTDDDRLTMYTCWNNGYLGMSDTRIGIICDLVKKEWKEVDSDEN